MTTDAGRIRGPTRPSWMRRFMTRRFQRRLRKCQGDFDLRIATWRDLSISSASLVNPYALVECSVALPRSPVLEYFPGKKAVVEVPDGGECTLDVIEVDQSSDAHDPLRVAYRSLDDAEVARSSGDHTSHKRQFFLAANSMKNAGRFLLRDRRYDLALRAFLNVERMRDRDPHTKRWLAICLGEVGAPLDAGFWFVQGARGSEKGNDPAAAADCYERAGLAWEVPYGRTKRPESGMGEERRDSTGCFRSAKSHFTVLGEYDEASRCYVLERDAHARWTWSRTRKAELAAMRWLWLYGESPLHAMRAIAVVWFACGAVFFYSGIESPVRVIKYTFRPELHVQGVLDFATSLYFSAVTMSTVGYGDYTPASSVSRFFSGFEAFAGVCLLAMFLVSVQRRYVGR